MMTLFFQSQSWWSWTLPISILVSKKFCGLGPGLGQVGPDYSSVYEQYLNCKILHGGRFRSLDQTHLACESTLVKIP